MTVQPEGGKTLVNFETIFYTTNNQPTSRIVMLLVSAGRDPGHAHVVHLALRGRHELHDDQRREPVSRSQDVVHVYAGLDPVQPSVDTVYSGRFRVNGGEWEAIDDTVAVAGDAVDLGDPGGVTRAGDRPGGVVATRDAALRRSFSGGHR